MPSATWTSCWTSWTLSPSAAAGPRVKRPVALRSDADVSDPVLVATGTQREYSGASATPARFREVPIPDDPDTRLLQYACEGC